MVHLNIFVFGAFCWLASSGEIISLIPSVSTETIVSSNIIVRRMVPLPKCCKDNQLYRTGLNYCRPGPIDSAVRLPVFSAAKNLSLTGQEYPEFELYFHPITCPDGFVGKYSTNFRFYDDSTLTTDTSSGKLKADEFCISEIPTDDDTNKTENFVARFCIPDSCTGCFRKCCPLGTVINKTTRMCQRDTTTAAVSSFRNVTFKGKKGRDSVKFDDYIVLDGVTPQCQDEERQPLNLSEFSLLPDGRMHVPSFPCRNERSTKQYCIDNFVQDDGQV